MTPEPEVIHVAVNRPLPVLTYRAEGELRAVLQPGMLVEVPLQNGSEIGCVVDAPAVADFADALFKLKPVTRRICEEYVINEELRRLAAWMAEYYFCSLGEALATVSVVGFSDTRLNEVAVYEPAPGWQQQAWSKRQAEILSILEEAGLPAAALAELARRAACTAPTLKKIVEAGGLCETTPVEAVPSPDVAPTLLPEQVEAIDAIARPLDSGEFQVFLLHGVTGSGKTEVYLQLIQRALEQGKSALCLVPEIALTPQTVERFTRRFQQRIGVYHSQTTRREKLLLHRRIQRGEVRVVIGARSSAFAPLPNLGLIVIDEEHEGSYKQGEVPRYHARDTAIVRARALSIPVVLGSATPSFETYENALAGKYRLLRLSARPMGLSMPQVEIVAMGKAALEDPGTSGMISPRLRDAIAERLAKGEQSLLFLNRRGFSNFLFCPHCRWVARCDEDDISLTIHRRRTKGSDPNEDIALELFASPLLPDEAWLKCHFCGRTSSYPKTCPNCGEADLAPIGSGTQRIEEVVRSLFPDANVLRMDQDSISGRRGFLEAWRQMVEGEAQIILGTQMIAKGLHLERVSLVGVILADIGLFIPDFRAEERTFSLLMQVAGRAGRTNMGEVIIQTYMPQHASIRLAAQHDYTTFFEAEMHRRRHLRFPPVERLIALTISDPDRGRAQTSSRALGGILRRLVRGRGFSAVAVLGPQAAPVERIGGRHRQRLLLRGADAKLNARCLRQALADRDWSPPGSTRLTVDVDPLDLL